MRVFASLSVSALAVAAMVSGFWLSVFDFTERGGTALACYIASLVAAAYGFGLTMMTASDHLDSTRDVAAVPVEFVAGRLSLEFIL